MAREQSKSSPMENIIKAYLALKFPEADMTTLYKVIAATGNEAVATEMLAGLYVEAILIQQSIKRSKNEINPTFISFDPFKNEVTYSYFSRESVEVWQKSGEELLTWETRKTGPKAYYGRDLATELGITPDEVSENWSKVYIYGPISEIASTSVTNLSNWQ